MKHENIRIKVCRKKQSYDFKENNTKPDSFENNWKNNSRDILYIIQNGSVIFCCKCQTVANYCFGEQDTGDTVTHGDTIAPGAFTLKGFVPPRSFHGEIHAITNTIDIDGQKIDRNAMQTTSNGYQNGRWLLHDRYSFKTGKDTNHAWSAGCIITSEANLVAFNKALRDIGIKPDDEISGIIIEV